MQSKAHTFTANARAALADEPLQAALARFQGGFPVKRRAAIDRLPEFDALRDAGKAIKDATLANLDIYLEQFEAKVIAAGGHVHWCEDADAARHAGHARR